MMKIHARPFFPILALIVFTGCARFIDHRPAERRPDYGRGVRFRPTLAVDRFDNRSGFSGQWDLGTGMAEVLTTSLIESGQFVVLERREIDSVLGELMRQGRELFRSEGRVNRGRLKNARYLLSGAITDFTVLGDTSGWFEAGTSAKIRGGGSRARVALHLRLVDVESGEVITSTSASGTASAGFFRAGVNYKNLAFGGDSFFRTPLGRATERATRRAIRDISRAVPKQYWSPRVAEATADTVIINGGENTGVRVGDRFVVREEGREVTDPVTGNVIEHLPGRVIGRIEIVSVAPLSAQGILIDGTAHRSAHLEAVR